MWQSVFYSRKEVEVMGIGDNLKRLREANGITQCELAEQVGITQSMLCQLERGTKTLSLPLAKEIAEILKCSIEDLIETKSE